VLIAALRQAEILLELIKLVAVQAGYPHICPVKGHTGRVQARNFEIAEKHAVASSQPRTNWLEVTQMFAPSNAIP
jgi:hypothetical protein